MMEGLSPVEEDQLKSHLLSDIFGEKALAVSIVRHATNELILDHVLKVVDGVVAASLATRHLVVQQQGGSA